MLIRKITALAVALGLTGCAGLMPDVYERSATQVAGLLKRDQIDAVFLTPV